MKSIFGSHLDPETEERLKGSKSGNFDLKKTAVISIIFPFMTSRDIFPLSFIVNGACLSPMIF